jgi:signal transduction histidine kinase
MDQPFPGQKPDEKIILFIRRHWISFLGFLGLVFGMIAVSAVFLVILAILLPDVFVAFLSPLILISSAYLLFTLAFFLVGWIDYYFDIVVVTDRRIIDIRQRGLFNRKIDELDILHVEDVSARTKGFLPTLFRYGDVYVQSAGAARNFLFRAVPYPQNVCRQIMSLYDEILAKQPEKIQKIDAAEGLIARHIHPSTGKTSTGFSSGVEPDEMTASNNFEEKPIENGQKGLDGEIPEGEEVDFDQGPPKY